MNSESDEGGHSDCLPIYEMLARWQLASKYLAEMEPDDRPEKRALRTLVDRDLPLLFLKVGRRPFGTAGIETPENRASDSSVPAGAPES